MLRTGMKLLALGVLVGGWYLHQQGLLPALDGFGVKLGAPADADVSIEAAGLPPVARQGETIRVASFNIQVFGESKLNKQGVMRLLAQTVRQFDVVAVQEVRAKGQDILPRFIEMINADGARHYDFCIGPRLGRTVSKEQYAFIFDTASMELDRESIYTVDDPDDLLHREPLVAHFRVRGPPREEAFTFTLVNIHTDPDEVEAEISVLDDVMRAVRNDGRGEDDVILLGDFNADDQHLGELGQIPGMEWAIYGQPTNTLGTAMYDNLVFNKRATSEYVGRSEVFDLMREFKLSRAEAQEVSDHLPVWGEFHVLEGGERGRVASGGRVVR